jgi:hypothetical protein
VQKGGLIHGSTHTLLRIDVIFMING